VPKPSAVRPTDAELAILRVLWQRGPSTVREVFDVITETRELGYTTVLKVIQIMSEKGLVVREEQGRNHIYRATRPEGETQRHLVADLLERAFGGSTTKLVMQALASKPASPEELREIRRLLDKATAVKAKRGT
jgi:predicted transcriptional regulator